VVNDTLRRGLAQAGSGTAGSATPRRRFGVILPDVKLLVYAYNSDAHWHQQARRWSNPLR